MNLDALLTGENAALVDTWYRSWREDPASVAPEWAELFAQLDQQEGTGHLGNGGGPLPGAVPQPDRRSIFRGAVADASAGAQADVMAVAARQARVAQLINAYRVRGHTKADIDPLDRLPYRPHAELDPGYWGLSDADMDVPVSGHPLNGVPRVTTLRHIIQRLEKAYCGSFGVEFMNIDDPDKKKWLQERFELLQDTRILSPDQERLVLRWLSDAENFEQLLHTQFPGTKRFSLEGGETLIPLLHELLHDLAERGVTNVIFGMAHRGRLNVLANVCEKPVKQIVAEFRGEALDDFDGSGDVKYHLGYTSQYQTVTNGAIELSLAFNPSHLEAVDPVVTGRARARQDREGGDAHRRIVPLLIHGDAAFAGQGLVAEVLNLSQLPGYRTGGTIHVVVNNQIGFTTSPRNARSTPYCTDVARMLAVPIFHVNGEDPEAVAAVVRIASEWRQTFHQDVVIDLYCFRKHGHNEGDEPSFTQPLLYEAIRNHPSPRVVYAQRIVERGTLTIEETDTIASESAARLHALLENGDDAQWTSYTGNTQSLMGKVWAPYRKGRMDDPVDTTFPKARMVELLLAANTVPKGFDAHRKIARLLAQRREMVKGKRPVDWAVGEQAAFASLIDQGLRVRLSGQDSGRGTFSHRHAVLTDNTTGEDRLPLQHLGEGTAAFDALDSLLSEAAVLGFEFGYALEYPDALVIWEAQFGDFANGAQVIIDNFIMSTEQKWNRNSGVVMLLPHGYAGQGPEHSSARLERYLQLCAEDNMFVANCTTPDNFFHLLRRQALQTVRKPLVVMSPKSLLRHSKVVCTLDDLAEGRFHKVIPETEDIDPAGVRRVIFCSGKLYYELLEAREERGTTDVAVVRLEQLYPFPDVELREVLEGYADDVEVVWCQEEPRNMGAWPMMDEWMGELLGGRPPRYVGRPRAASPATGSPSKHKAEREALLNEALDLD